MEWLLWIVIIVPLMAVGAFVSALVSSNSRLSLRAERAEKKNESLKTRLDDISAYRGFVPAPSPLDLEMFFRGVLANALPMGTEYGVLFHKSPDVRTGFVRVDVIEGVGGKK